MALGLQHPFLGGGRFHDYYGPATDANIYFLIFNFSTANGKMQKQGLHVHGTDITAVCHTHFNDIIWKMQTYTALVTIPHRVVLAQRHQ